MKKLILTAAVFASGCATTPAGLHETNVETTVLSAKTPAAFATCAAENLVGEIALRSDGDHYWVLISYFDVPRARWDFLPTPEGSKAELRSTSLFGGGVPSGIRDCA